MSISAGRSRGFTLIEVLVSMVVLSIGLLGTAKLMLFSSRANDSAYLRTQATALAYEMLDDIRANRQQAINGLYDTASGTVAADPGFVCVGAAVCTPPNLALYDVYQWKQRLDVASGVAAPGALPTGRGSVVTTTTAAQTSAVITVSWDDSVTQNSFDPGGAGSTQSIVLETVL
jgi:type IV pilus assembly protein PilV